MINLHTNVYPCKSGADDAVTGGKRSRECACQDTHTPAGKQQTNTHASGAAGCTGLLGNDAVAIKVATSTHATSARSTTAVGGGVGGAVQETALRAFDEELRRFVGARCDGNLANTDAGAEACEFESGREFVFGDLVRDSTVLAAARRALAGTVPCNTRHTLDSLPAPTSTTATTTDLVGGIPWPSPASRSSSSLIAAGSRQATSLPMTEREREREREIQAETEEQESFRVRTAVTHGILRLSQRGWLVLTDHTRDAYIYVSICLCVCLSLLKSYLAISTSMSLCKYAVCLHLYLVHAYLCMCVCMYVWKYVRT
jgi:hypothetical protein